MTDQHLQQYESYQIMRYFDNISPGGNGGGWVDIYDTRYLDRYAEQLWDTMLAKTPQIMLFQYSDLLKPAEMGERKAWSGLETSFNLAGLEKWHAATGSTAPANYASCGRLFTLQSQWSVGKLGNPIGMASYKPYQSTGEDFLHNYLGMIGIPIDLHPEFPADAKTILLTESAKFDPADREQDQDASGAGRQHGHYLRPIERASRTRASSKIAEIHSTGNILKVTEYWGAYGAGSGANLGATSEILVPEIASRPTMRGRWCAARPTDAARRC